MDPLAMASPEARPATAYPELAPMLADHDDTRKHCAQLAAWMTRAPSHPLAPEQIVALRELMRFFDAQAPLHHEQEEEVLFPMLLAQHDPALTAHIRQLQEEHHDMTASWIRLRPALHRLIEGVTDPLPTARLQSFLDLHADHIKREEQVVWPLARALLERHQSPDLADSSHTPGTAAHHAPGTVAAPMSFHAGFG